MKRYIRSATEDLTKDSIKKTIFQLKRSKQLHYDTVSNLAKGIRLGYKYEEVRQKDLEYLETANIAGISEWSIDDALSEQYIPKYPYYIRLRFTATARPASPAFDDFRNVAPEDKSVFQQLVDLKIIPTISTSKSLQSNRNYPEAMKYIELIKTGDGYREYSVPYNRSDFYGNRIYATSVYVYDDGSVSIAQNPPMQPANNSSKLRSQFKQSHWDF